MSDARAVMRYVMYRLDPAWRRLPDEERALHKKDFAAVMGAVPCAAHPYSLVGLREDADLCIWFVADEVDQIQAAQAALNGTELGRSLEPAASYLALTRKSRYLKGHRHDGQEAERPPGPVGERFLFVYPMDKQRAWYRLPFDERRAMMAEHFKVGHSYPEVIIHTGYSFGIDDQEFVVAFEGPSVAQFLDLVEELRGSAASAYTARDIPIYTGVRLPIDEILDQFDGTTS